MACQRVARSSFCTYWKARGGRCRHNQPTSTHMTTCTTMEFQISHHLFRLIKLELYHSYQTHLTHGPGVANIITTTTLAVSPARAF